MKRQLLFLKLLTLSALMGCDNHVTLSPKVSRFVPAIHLQKMDGSEQISPDVQAYIHDEQNTNRNIASTENSNSTFSPGNKSKFPLPYFLIPEKNAKFLRTQTLDERVIDALSLKISGKKHYKFFVHPAHELDFEFLRRSYDYVGVDLTEFLATPTTDNYTLVVWNRNNSKRRPFVAKLDPEKPIQGIKVDSQIIQDVPIKVADEKH